MKAKPNERVLSIEPQRKDFAETYALDSNYEGGINLKQILETLQRRFVLVASITTAIATLAILKPLTSQPQYNAVFEIFVEPVTIETKVASKESKDSTTEEEIISVKLDDVQLKILKSPQILDPIVKQLKAKYPEVSYQSLYKDLTITTNKTQNLLTVTYNNTNEQQVEDAIDAIAQAYMNYSLETRQAGANRGIKFLDEQIPLIQTRVQKLQEQLQKIRQKNNFIDPKVQAEQLAGRLETLTKQQQDVQSQIRETQLFANNLTKELTNNPSDSNLALELGTPYYKELRQQLTKINIKIAEQSAIFSDNNEEIQRLKEERQEILNLIEKEAQKNQSILKKRIDLLENQETTYQTKINNLQQEIKALSVVTRKYDNILREIDVVSSSINQFVIEKEGLRVYAAQKTSPWNLLTPPTKPQKYTPSLLKYSVLGTSLGFLFGLALATILENQNNTLNSLHQVRSITMLPVVGKIPFNREYKKLAAPKQPVALIEAAQPEQKDSVMQLVNNMSAQLENFPFIEEFNFLYANLNFLRQDTSIRSLTVSSSIAGEGKSTVAINLARAVAAIGKKVLLVDADLRSSNEIYSSIISKSDLGLSDYLCLDRLDVRSVIQPSLVDRNLFVMTSGWLTNNPIKLIDSEKMQQLIKELQKNFDLVIYDTSSLIGYADVNILASRTDGIIIVTALGKLKKNLLQEALEQLNLSRIPVFGIVVNQLN
jgi:capsular exopolysaccharide synthesis family protein